MINKMSSDCFSYNRSLLDFTATNSNSYYSFMLQNTLYIKDNNNFSSKHFSYKSKKKLFPALKLNLITRDCLLVSLNHAVITILVG